MYASHAPDHAGNKPEGPAIIYALHVWLETCELRIPLDRLGMSRPGFTKPLPPAKRIVDLRPGMWLEHSKLGRMRVVSIKVETWLPVTADEAKQKEAEGQGDGWVWWPRES